MTRVGSVKFQNFSWTTPFCLFSSKKDVFRNFGLLIYSIKPRNTFHFDSPENPFSSLKTICWGEMRKSETTTSGLW